MPEVCAPGDELKNVFVKLTNGQYVIYVRSAGYEIPVAYTNRKLTTITPISALLGLTIMGLDPKKITDPTEYKKLYDAVKGVLPAIQDEMLYMKGKANYAIRIDAESLCMRTDKLRFLLEQVQDRYLINIVPPEIFKPSIIEAPTKIPERYKVGIPVEIGVPAEIVRPPPVEIPPVEIPKPAVPVETPELVRAEIEKALAEIEQQKAIATAAGLTDLASRMEDLIRWYRERVRKADELLLIDPERGLASLKDIRDSVVNQVESYRDHLARRLRFARLPSPELEKLRDMARRAGFWDLATEIGGLIERAPPAPPVAPPAPPVKPEFTVSIGWKEEWPRGIGYWVFTITTSPAQPGKPYVFFENDFSIATGLLDSAGRATVRIPFEGKPPGYYTYYARVNTTQSNKIEKAVLAVVVKPPVEEAKAKVEAGIKEAESLLEQAKAAGRWDIVSQIERLINWAKSEVGRRVKPEDIQALESQLRGSISQLEAALRRIPTWFPTLPFPLFW